MNSETSGRKDKDILFLEQVLDSLYDFGSLQKNKPKSQKKKKRQRCSDEEEKQLARVNNTCGNDDDDANIHIKAEHKTDQTGPAVGQENGVEVVMFQDPKKRSKTKHAPEARRVPTLQIEEEEPNKQQEQLSLEKARLEVHRFGLTGYKKEQQRVFERDRAVMLGARPPKKEYVNYKVLQEKIKEKKQKEREEIQPDIKKKKKSKQRDQTKKSSGSASALAPSGQLGRFKNGMLILSSKEIQKVKSHK